MKTIYLKLTNRCNLHCKHCYNAYSSSSSDMCDKVLDASLTYVKKIASENEVLLVFHGGEPLLVNVDKYLSIISRIAHEKNIKLSMTTNLIYEITDKHLQLFKHFIDLDGYSVSTSWDYRIRFNQKQEELWRSNVRKLVNDCINVKPIVTVTKQLIQHYQDTDELFSQLKQLGIHTMNFERLTMNGRAIENDLRPTNREVDAWLYDAYMSSKKFNVKVVLFDTLEEAVRNKNYIGCRRRQCVKDVVTIDPDGTISGCPNVADIKFGNVFGEVNDENVICEMHKEQSKSNCCYMCKYFKFCNGECYQLKFDETGCPGMKNIMKNIVL